MFPPLLPYEGELLLWINSHHTPWLDAFMYMISHTTAWIPLVVALLYYLCYKKPWQETFLLLMTLLLCLLLGHLLANVWAKPYFARLRPTYALEFSSILHVVYGYKGHLYGFFSGHACNFFGAATVLACAVGRRGHSILLFGIVSLVAYSRMYLGVHLPSDILVGLFVGISLGLMCNKLREYIRKRYIPSAYRLSRDVFSPGYSTWLAILAVFIPLLMIYALQVIEIIERLS